MQLTSIDWVVMALYAVTVVVIGLVFTRRAGSSTESYFLAGRKLPWWLLGTSMVATTFSTDTPNLVTDLVRTGGVSQNWVWWAFLITGMCTTFFYAKLWRRSGALTDLEFYELRYSGPPAAFLRGFRAFYLGVFFNCMLMAGVTLAAIKIAAILLGVDKYTTVVVAASITVLYSATSGLWGVVVTDLLLFFIAMIGSFAAAYFAVQHPDVGGLTALFAHPNVNGKLAFLPDFADRSTFITVLVIPLAVQWWSTWYPGSEPGGGGYAAQRMLASRDEKSAMGATLWFNVAHYALRPWPWILVALASLVVYPDLASISSRFPSLDQSIIGNDLGYPAMLIFLPHGLLGLVVASLAAAYMSTISTHLNWGASYLVGDYYRRFVRSDAPDAHYVNIGRFSTVILIIISCTVALFLESAYEYFQVLLQIGAGTGLVFLLRWFWWRVNAWSEISAMVVSFVVAVALRFVDLDAGTELVIGVGVTTVAWLSVTFLTEPSDRGRMQQFYDRIKPMAYGWRTAVHIDTNTGEESPAAAVACWLLGCVMVYSALFATGYLLYGDIGMGLSLATLAALASLGVFHFLPRIGLHSQPND